MRKSFPLTKSYAAKRMSNSYKVIVTGVADVRDQEKTPITDPALLQKLDGIEYRGDNFRDYLEAPNERSLAEVLNPGGDIALKFDKTTGFLLYVTEYEATRELTKDELKFLTILFALWVVGLLFVVPFQYLFKHHDASSTTNRRTGTSSFISAMRGVFVPGYLNR